MREGFVDLPSVWLYYRVLGKREPLLVLLGRYDLTSVETAEDMARRIPRGRFVVFEESGHFMFVEEPEKFLSEARAFLATPVWVIPRPHAPGAAPTT